jgi:hypothetical protein
MSRKPKLALCGIQPYYSMALLAHISTEASTRVWRQLPRNANCRLLSTVTGESTSPGEDPTGASAEREGGFDPQPKAELAQGEYKGARDKGSTGTTRPPSRGVARGGAKDPTGDPAELHVLF